jgi:hypothetical protein
VSIERAVISRFTAWPLVAERARDGPALPIVFLTWGQSAGFRAKPLQKLTVFRHKPTFCSLDSLLLSSNNRIQHVRLTAPQTVGSERHEW